ncbi:glycosyltransferase family 4 protein [Pseudoalteromonas sp. DL2-H2.2]|uniref:glycosyltransferase family 4 protein n=1 Tax=Pseudoalteromonas sp. DL2-H2.2 TaxID=2908889 RepID=UPI001F174F28|nr:glycosyltransferase family 4 protein [Pseudoalteromonas sp. DL2-H2.2]MCF2908827.1 glycosyltransferase family 4 protein [Pseudoalteromonas sp. DL2-H2.2]
MKTIVIFIHSMSSGGAERVTSILSNNLVKQGYRVILLTHKSAQSDFYYLDPAIERSQLPEMGEVKGAIGRVINNIEIVRHLRRLVKKEAPVAVVGMMSHSAVHVALAGIGGRNCEYIGSERSYPPKVPLGRGWELIRKYAYGYLSRLVVLSSESEMWASQNTNCKSVTIIPNPVELPLQTSKPILPVERFIRADQKLLLTVGRLGKEKGHKVLIKAAAPVLKCHPEWKLVIVGEGPERENLEQLIRELGVQDRVALPGKAGNIDAWYNRADAFALTSELEGFPNALVEAMAHGTAVVSFDCDTGPRDIIENGANGFLIQPSIDALTEHLTVLFSDEGIRKELSKNALEVKERFSINKFINNWLDVING